MKNRISFSHFPCYFRKKAANWYIHAKPVIHIILAPFGESILSLKGWKFLAYKILVLVTKPENLGTSWPQCFFVPCDAPFACNACFYKGLPLKNCRKACFNDLLLVFPATSSNQYSVLKQSCVKCSLHTYTFVSFFGMNLSSWRSCSNHFFGNFLFFAGKSRKVTPLSLSFSVRVLQPGAQHFSSQLNKRI